MAENQITNQEEINENEDYDVVNDITSWKQSHVPKDKYEALEKENRKLTKALMNGETLGGAQAPDKPKTDKAKLRQELYGQNANCGVCEYFEKTLELREADLADGKPDPFWGKGINFTDAEKAVLSKASETYRHCLDVAQGDDSLFVMELQRLTNDVQIPRRSKR